MPRFTDEQRANWLLQLEVLGYPDNIHAPSQIAKQKNAPSARSLKRWYSAEQNRYLDKVADNKRPDIVTQLSELLQLHVDTSKELVMDTDNLNHVNTGIGILIDKIQLLTGGATGRTENDIIIRYNAD